jgi:hypothetical protein
MKSKKPKRNYKKELDEVFAEYIRLRDSNGDTFRCISCGQVKPMSQCQCGHYISRAHMATRFDEKNCNGQCVSCNIFKSGNVVEYRFGLIDKYGEEVVNQLEAMRNDQRQIKDPEYKELIQYYKDKVKQMKDEL